MSTKLLGFCMFVIVLPMVDSTVMGQDDEFELNMEVIVADEPPGICFRTSNTSCSNHVRLPSERPMCANRVCGWGQQVWVPDDPKVPQGPGHWYTPPVCTTPAGQQPFQEDILPIEVSNVADAPDGTGHEEINPADPVNCVGRFNCKCEVQASQLGNPCGRETNEYVTDHPVTGYVVDLESPVCEGGGLPGDGDENGGVGG